MIDAALGHLAGQLNQHFRRHYGLPEELAVVSNLFDATGAGASSANNKVVLFVSSIERETAAHQARPTRAVPANGGGYVRATEPVFLNILMMCAANFSGSSYPEALKFLSAAIAYFQSKPVFDRQNTPELDPRIDRLVLNIENLGPSEMHSLWSIHGGRYLPSVLYRIRMVNLDGNAALGREAPVRDVDVGVAT